MKSKKFAQKLAWIAILGGILIYYASTQRWYLEFVYLVPTFVEDSGWVGLVRMTSILLFVFSFAGMVHYSEGSRVSKASHNLLFSAGIVGFIPFLGTLSAALSVVSGICYLRDLKNFQDVEK